MKKFLSLVLTLVFICSLVGCTSSSSPTTNTTTATTETSASDAAETSNDNPIRIGMSTPLTGTNAESGARQSNAVKLAVDEQNAAGGLLGRTIELDVQDDQYDATKSVNVANYFVSGGDITAVIGPMPSTNSLAVAPIYEEAGIPLISLGSSPKLVDAIEEGNEWMFMIRAGDALTAGGAADVIINEYDVSTIGVMYVNSEFGIGALEVVQEKCAEAGITVIAEAHNTDDTDVSGQLLNLKNANIELMVVWTNDNEYALIARQAYELGLDIPVVTCPGVTMSTVRNMCQAEWIEGWVCIADFIDAIPDSYASDFINAYVETYGGDANLHSAVSYAGAKYLFAAIELAGTDDPAAVRDAMEKVQGVSVPTDPNAYCDDSHILVHQVFACEIVDNEPVLEFTVSAN